MEYLLNLILETVGMGVFTLIIGHIVFHLGIDKIKRKEIKQYNKHLSLTLFMIGVVLHIILETGGLNKWYCDKKCTVRI